MYNHINADNYPRNAIAALNSILDCYTQYLNDCEGVGNKCVQEPSAIAEGGYLITRISVILEPYMYEK